MWCKIGWTWNRALKIYRQLSSVSISAVFLNNYPNYRTWIPATFLRPRTKQMPLFGFIFRFFNSGSRLLSDYNVCTRTLMFQRLFGKWCRKIRLSASILQAIAGTKRLRSLIFVVIVSKKNEKVVFKFNKEMSQIIFRGRWYRTSPGDHIPLKCVHIHYLHWTNSFPDKTCPKYYGLFLKHSCIFFSWFSKNSLWCYFIINLRKHWTSLTKAFIFVQCLVCLQMQAAYYLNNKRFEVPINTRRRCWKRKFWAFWNDKSF